MNKTSLISTAYFPPIQYFHEIANSDVILLERHENYIKQSYRNRCKILSANGVQTLSIPIKKKSGQKTKILDTRIDYSENWQSVHFKAIATAYQKSPFYEFYIDAFMKFFKNKYKFLFDFNRQIIETLISEIELDKKINFTDKYENLCPDKTDLRNIIHPKSKKNDFSCKKYQQVFNNKFNFVDNLSIIDLLFNEGTNTYSFL